MSQYAVVHLVAQESFKGLIGPQVVDHMAFHASWGNGTRPARVVIGLLEAARVALSPRFRSRLAQLRARAPELRVVPLPYVGRLGITRNAWAVARRLRREVGSLPVVFHCRGESAGEWAGALRRYFPGSGIVLDVRGPWPDEFLYACGHDGPDQADHHLRATYFHTLGKLQQALASADEVFSVSPGMLEWLRGLGVKDERLTYVPCCATPVLFSEDARKEARARLGLEHRLVFAYLGVIRRYQHVHEGAVPFFKLALESRPDAHLLVITPDVEAVREALTAANIPASAITLLTLPQEQVGGTLVAADAGFLLRVPSRLTQVVQPVKLGEYLSAGVPVIVSRGAGRVDELIAGSDAGVVTDFGLPEGDDASEVHRVTELISQRGPMLRANAAALCRRELLWPVYGEAVRRAYERSLAAGSG
jgi:glycosyltransferase involved in cell wall biosynthesis